jgi:hypothetical protein
MRLEVSRMDASAVTTQLDDLLKAQAAFIAKEPPYSTAEQTALAVRMEAAIERLAPRSSRYVKEAERIRLDQQHNLRLRVVRLAGVLKALKEDVNAGWLQTVEELVHADTFSDFLEQARELKSKGYKDAAAVLAGTVLESHLRLLCDKNSIPTTLPAGRHKTADSMNAELAKGGVYNQLQQKQVTAWLGTRNASAHGNYDEYTGADVVSLISGVEQFIINNPA